MIINPGPYAVVVKCAIKAQITDANISNRDKKRLIYKLEMTHKDEGYRAATTEVCSLYVDLNIRKVTEIEQDKQKQIDEFINENKDSFEPGNLSLVHKLKK